MYLRKKKSWMNVKSLFSRWIELLCNSSKLLFCIPKAKVSLKSLHSSHLLLHMSMVLKLLDMHNLNEGKKDGFRIKNQLSDKLVKHSLQQN